MRRHIDVEAASIRARLLVRIRGVTAVECWGVSRLQRGDDEKSERQGYKRDNQELDYRFARFC